MLFHETLHFTQSVRIFDIYIHALSLPLVVIFFSPNRLNFTAQGEFCKAKACPPWLQRLWPMAERRPGAEKPCGELKST
jgi:hypothetical protein